MEYLNTAQELLDFIMRCKSPFHVVKEAGDLLNENGYTKLEETKEWSLVPGGKYYVTRNESSVIAFQIPESAFSSYQIIASHSDCPTFPVHELLPLQLVEDQGELVEEGGVRPICRAGC